MGMRYFKGNTNGRLKSGSVFFRRPFRFASGLIIDFDFSRRGDGNNVYREMQRQAGEGVVGIEDYAVAADFADEEGARTVFGVGLHGHAFFELRQQPGQVFPVHAVDGVFVAQAVAFLRGDGDVEVFARFAVHQGVFEAGDDFARACGVAQGLAAPGVRPSEGGAGAI